MKLLIDIDEERYNRIIEHYDTFSISMKYWGVEAIKEGQPIHELRVLELPKYDIDELKKLLNDKFGYLDTDSNTILTSNDVNNK